MGILILLYHKNNINNILLIIGEAGKYGMYSTTINIITGFLSEMINS